MFAVQFLIWQGVITCLAFSAQKSYWKYFFSSCIASSNVIALALLFTPERSSNTLTGLLNWISYLLIWAPIVMSTVAVCVFLSPLQSFWSPLDYFMNAPTPHAPIKEVQYLYDPASGSESIDIQGIEAE